MHTYVILMYLLRKIYLSNCTQLLICLVLRGVECTLAFINFFLGGRASRGRRVRAAHIAGCRRS